MTTPTHPSRRTNARPRSSAVTSERGFGLIEVMVAALLLAIGLLATVQIVDQANASSAVTRAREGSTNVVRQVVEGVNSLPYTSLTPGTIDAQLQAIPGLADASGAAGWQVVQRGVTYTLATTMCTVDDPRDGKGAQDATFCASSGPAGTTDIFPADYQRVTTTVSWRVNSKNYSAQVVAVVTPRQTADVPQVTALTSSSASPITSALASVSFTVTTVGNTAGVVWSVDGSQRGLASGSGTSWTFSWPISTLVDGDYIVGAPSTYSEWASFYGSVPRFVLNYKEDAHLGRPSKPPAVAALPGLSAPPAARARQPAGRRRLVILGACGAAALHLGVEDLLELLGEPGPHPGPGPRRGVVVAPAGARRLGRRKVVGRVAGWVVGRPGGHRVEGGAGGRAGRAGPGAGRSARL